MSKALTAFDDLRHANGLDAHLCPEVPHDDFHPGWEVDGSFIPVKRNGRNIKPVQNDPQHGCDGRKADDRQVAPPVSIQEEQTGEQDESQDLQQVPVSPCRIQVGDFFTVQNVQDRHGEIYEHGYRTDPGKA